MKIVIVAPEHPYSTARGGIARYLRDYLPALSDRADVTLVSTEDGPAPAGVAQRVVSSCSLPSPFRPPVYSRRIQGVLAELQPDVVEYANWLGLGCAERGRWPLVVRLSTPVYHATLRAGLLPRLARPIHHKWEEKTVKNADLWISNTHENLQTCRQVYRMAPPSVVIPHGLAFTRSDPREDARDVLFVGRFEERKGLDLLLQAWEMLAKKNLTGASRLHLVGRDTPGRSGSYLQDCLTILNSAPEKLGIAVAGNVEEATLRELRKNCAVSVVPSRYESFGMVVLEAYAAGHLVVASNAGGLKEVVDDGKTGVLFNSGNVQDLTDALQKTLSLLESNTDMVAAGRRILTTRFAPERMVEASLDAYRRAIQLHARR